MFEANPANGQLHVGVLYAGPHEPLRFLHLAFHARLTDELFHTSAFQPTRPYIGVIPNVDPELWLSVVAVCKRVALRNKRNIPYGVLYEGGRFLQDGRIELGKSAHGLTCATFVLHIFESVGKTLLDLASWHSRADDAAWHKHIVEILREFQRDHPSEIADQHINGVESEVGCMRIRPEEVVGGSTSPSLPASFAIAQQRGALVRDRLTGVAVP